MGVGALHRFWKGFDDCNYSPTLWHGTQWKTTIRQLLFLTADTSDVHTKAAHFVTALFTLEVHLCMWICEGCPLLFVFVALYKLSRFMHTVCVNLSLSTQSCRSPPCSSLQTCTHPLVCTQSPRKDLNQYFWGLHEALDGCVGDRDVIFVLSSSLFSLPVSHFPCSTMCWMVASGFGLVTKRFTVLQKIKTEDFQAGFKTENPTSAQQALIALGKSFKWGVWGLLLKSEHTCHCMPLEILGYN